MLFKVMSLAPFRYLLMAIKTFQKFCSEKPKVIIAQNPPVFLPLIGWIYCVLTGCKLIIDHHCIWSVKVIRHPVLHDVIKALEAFIVKRAKLNTSPHDVWTNMLRNFGRVNALTVIDYVWAVNPRKMSRTAFCKTKYLVVYPGGSGVEERPDLAVKAVQELDEVTLVITGKKQYLKAVLSFESARIVFSGFVPRSDYYGILEASDVVLNLSEEPYTIPHFIYEAIALSKPVISSPDKAVQENFDSYLPILESINIKDVKTEIMDVLGNLDLWTEKACLLQKKLRDKRETQIKILKDNIESYMRSSHAD